MYHTLKGDFPTLAELRHAYLKSGEDMGLDPKHAGQDDWESDRLHASEVSFCPRATCLRIMGAPKKTQGALTAANEALMFWVAYRLHYVTYEAMQWAGILVAHELSVLEPPWAGRVDAIIRPNVDEEGTVLYDAKTVRPNAFKFSEQFPKEDNCIQIGVYATVRPENEAIIEYIDRGGSNPPVECRFALDTWRHEAQPRMDALEVWYKGVEGHTLKTATLPPILPEKFTAHWRKASGQPRKELTSVTFDCPWQCSYCDYHHTDPTTGNTLMGSPCIPSNHPVLEVAKKLPKKDGGGWTYSVPEGLAGRFESWFAGQPQAIDLDPLTL
jgi:hypothetical protein